MLDLARIDFSVFDLVQGLGWMASSWAETGERACGCSCAWCVERMSRWYVPETASPVRVRPWHFGARVQGGPNVDCEALVATGVVTAVLRKPGLKELTFWAQGCTLVWHDDYPMGGYSPGRSALVNVWSCIGGLLAAETYHWKVLDENMSDIDLREDCGVTCDLTDWWNVWVTFIRLSTHLTMLHGDADAFENCRNWTERMINFEVYHAWRETIVRDVGTYLLQETDVNTCRKIIVRKSRRIHREFIMRLARAGWAPVFQSWPEMVLLLVARKHNSVVA